MRRIGALTALLCALAATPAAAAPCKRTEAGPRYATHLVRPGLDRPYVLVLCDRRRGSRRVLARPDGTTPVYLGNAVVAGRRITWPEVRRIDAHTDGAYVVRRTLPAGRPRRTLVSARPRTSLSQYGSIGFEDGTSTIRWSGSYLDLRPLPSRNGCPVRERFRPLATYGDVQVTAADYVDDDDLASRRVLRVCRHGSGRDPVFAGSFGALGSGDGYVPVGIDGDALVVEHRTYSRYSGCERMTVERYSISTGALLGRGDEGWCPG